MTKKKNKFASIWIVAILPILVFSCGAFGLSNASHQKRLISKDIATCEAQINNLRRTNDELSVKIAEQENPMRLMKRATSKLTMPDPAEKIVWAYEHFEGGKIVYSHKRADNTISFIPPEKKIK